MGTRLRLALLGVLVVALVGCGDSPPATPQSSAPAAAPSAPSAEAPPVPAETAEQLLARANAALADDRLFEPAGDNALELYLAAVEQAEEMAGKNKSKNRRSRRLTDSMSYDDLTTQTRLAIADVMPFGMIWVEQAIRADRRGEAARVLSLLERAQPGAGSLKRLRDQLDDANAQAERAIAQAAAVAEAAASAAAAADSAATVAEPVAPAAELAAALPEPPPSVPVDPTPEEAPPPAAAQPVATAPAVPAKEALPRLLSQPTLRYPQRAVRRGTQGYVEIGFTILPNGSTGNVRVVRAEPRNVFEQEAVRFIEGMKFEPPGREIQGERRINFQLAE